MPCFAMEKEMEVIMDQLYSNIIFAIMAIMGGGSSLLIVILLPMTIIWKLYRKIRYGYKMTD